jgi:hypothetical protein
MDRLMECKNTIDDSVRVVARDFMKKHRPHLLKAKKKPLMSDDDFAKVGTEIMKQAKAKSSLRTAAFDMYHRGASAADVAKTLCITYANAHYYKRAFKKEFS